MRWPIVQLGWATACSGVAPRRRSSGQSRNGPPEAVRMTRSTEAGSSPVSAWKTAECSLSTGRIVAPWALASASIRGPAVTRLSLLASASVPPWRSARRPGTSPAAPTMPDMTQSAGRSAASAMAAGPAAASTPEPASAARKSGRQSGCAVTATSAPKRRACRASSPTCRPPVRATTCTAPGTSRSSGFTPIEPVAPKTEIRRIRRGGPARATRHRGWPRWWPRSSRRSGPSARHARGSGASCP
jgi:hypothetical protein